MHKKAVKLFAFLTVAVIFATVSAAIVGATRWFFEDASSFVENVDRRWSYPLGFAVSEGGRINYGMGAADDGVLVYAPPPAAVDDYVVSEVDYAFEWLDSPGRDAEGGFIGVHLVAGPGDDNAHPVFEVIDSFAGDGDWRTTSVRGSTGVVYTIRIEMNLRRGYEVASYSFRPAGSSAGFTKIANVLLPSGVVKPKEIDFCGRGSLGSIEMATKAAEEDEVSRYRRWAELDDILTWEGSAGSIFKSFVFADNVWKEGSATYSGAAAEARFPNAALRFKSGVTPQALAASASPLKVSGLIVEPSAGGYSLAATAPVMFGDQTGKRASWYSFESGFAVSAPSKAITFYGESQIYVKSGVVLDLSSASSVNLDSGSYTGLRLSGGGSIKLPAAGLDATGSVVIDYSGCEAGAAAGFLNGSVTVDASTAFVLPEGVAEGEEFTLCTGEVSGGGSGAVKRSISVGGVSFSADVTITGNKLRYARRSYAANWKGYTGMFTWCGSGASFDSGAFSLFDVDAGSDTSTVFEGDAAAEHVPGWEGLTVPRFNWVFSAMTRTTNSFSLAREPGYALRFSSAGYRGELTSLTRYLSFGGLLVDSGATGCGLVGAGDQSNFLVLGDYSGCKTNRVEISENFSIGDFGSVEIVGTTAMEIPGGRTLAVDGMGRSAGTGFPDRFPELRVGGGGTLKCNMLRAGGPSTLDFSALPVDAATPFVDGAIELDAAARLVLPEGLGEAQKFPLCTGSITAGNGIRAVAKGSGEFFLANVTFDFAAKKVSYQRAAVDAHTLSPSGSKWSDYTFTGKPVELTLTADTTLEINSDVALPALLVKGPYRLSIVATRAFNGGNMFLGRDTICEIVYRRSSSALLMPSLTVDNALPVDAVIDAESSAELVLTGRVAVTGCLRVRGKVRLTNAENDFDSQSHLIVEKNARLTVADAKMIGNRVDVLGELCAAGEGMEIGGDARIGFKQGASLTAEEPATVGFVGPATISVKADSGNGAAMVMAPVVFDAPVALIVDSGMSLGLGAANSTLSRETLAAAFGRGSLNLTGETTVAFDAGSFVFGGATGNANAAFYDDPSGVVPAIFNNSWTGVCRLLGTELVAFNPARLGNANSSISYEGAYGYFAENAIYNPKTVLTVVDGIDFALMVERGYERQAIDLGAMSGAGRLYLPEEAGGVDFRVFMRDAFEFGGSVTVEGEGSRAGVAIGLNPLSVDDLNKAFDESGRGAISLYRDEAVIGEGAVWSAPNGIFVDRDTRLTDNGIIDTFVTGTGTVRYTGLVGEGRVETSVARYTDADNWRGTVQIDKATIAGFDIMGSGNANSVLEFREASGYLPNGIDVPFTVRMALNDTEGGLTVTSAEWHGNYAFSKIVGPGVFKMTYGSEGDSSCFRLRDVSEFEGKIRMNAYSASLVLGDDEPMARGALEVSDGFTIKSNRDWEAPRAVFHERVIVDGIEGDNVFKVIGEAEDYSAIDVTLTGSGDPHIRHRIAYDSGTYYLYVNATATPPSAKIIASEVLYGVDLAKAGVRFTVSDWWTGYDFEGRVIAEVTVRDSTGRVVGYASREIDGNGTYELDDMGLPPGCRGNYYDYEISISTEDSRTGEFTESDARAIVSADAVLSVDSWIYENAETFGSREPSGRSATGLWTLPSPQAAEVTNGYIAIDTSATGGTVNFTAATLDSNDVARIQVNITIGAQVLNSIEELNEGGVPAGARGAVSIVGTGDYGDIPGWAVWDPSGQCFVKAYANDGSTARGEHTLCWTIYHRIGVISYSVDGLTLTNESGSAVFPLRSGEAEARAGGVDFQGYVDVKTVVGSQDTAKLARVVGADGTTNEYETVDEAVAAATNASDRVGLIWNATWRPSTNFVGRTYDFDLNGYRVYVDEAVTNRIVTEGYRLIDNGNGSYTIGVVEYELVFLPNGGSGTMPSQVFSVTNMVFNLVSNVFTDVGADYSLDFSHWNMMADGTGEENWSDGGVIDLRPYGLGDKSLYAQWKVSVRALTIEPTDEFVYLELVTTNGVEHRNVRYVAHPDPVEAKKGRGSAIVPIAYGSDVKLVFTTDLELRLDWSETNLVRQIKADTLVYEKLPKLLSLFTSVRKAAVDLWAANNNVKPGVVASTYALISCSLGLSHVATPSSEVSISEFKVTDEGCSFKVTIDDDPVTQVEQVLPLVRVTGSLDGEWSRPSADAVRIGEDGSVEVKTEKDAFIKLDIPID